MWIKPPFVLLLGAVFAYGQVDQVDKGHSAHGTAFDIGPRQKPWVMEGIGVAPFPITTKNPEVQQWFNQGNALLHSFWFYEAERSFRWCLKLEPDNAMAYWGLARSTEGDRAADFLREAVKRKDKVTERERMYIEAEEAVSICESHGYGVWLQCARAFQAIAQGDAGANAVALAHVAGRVDRLRLGQFSDGAFDPEG